MVATKDHILHEIRRTAEANGGHPVGRQRFYAETGIKETDWSGRYWARWNDALQEAGYSPNRLQSAYDELFLLGKLASYVQRLGHFPTIAELKLERRQDPTFPSHNTFARFGGRARLAGHLAAFCQQQGGYEDVVTVCAAITSDDMPEEPRNARGKSETFGSVYLLRSGRYYKVGRTNAVGRRERELATQLPERAHVVHSIKTEDPPGIEAYWHTRFKDQRKNG